MTATLNDTIKFTDITIHTLSELVDEPELDEKLLLKPPYRFVFDIVMTIIKKTGFIRDIFSSDELDSGKPFVCRALPD
ncbi:MAG: hypothetical protein EZS28_015551 [Streblomastix strix]|uniref:TRAF3-interacting protein 1 N-terminal domain-containing protein n=1 Tax=Streblomastix strix TaxID=222440 RepID=A0A5J4W1Y7_9EUKA|nr:MAG: hypothetical protein EZS28_015551 [Streblomastix strix]